MSRHKLIHLSVSGSIAGGAMGLLDLMEILFAHAMFFSAGEMALAALYTLFIDIALGTLLLPLFGALREIPAALLRKLDLAAHPFWNVASLAAALLGPALYLLLKLTGGPRASLIPGRHLIVLLAGLVGSVVAALIVALLPEIIAQTRRRRASFAGLAVVISLVLHLVDTTVLVRLYPLFHLSLTALVLIVLGGAAAMVLPPIPKGIRQRAFAGLSLALLICGGVLLNRTYHTQNIRFVIAQETGAATDVLAVTRPLAMSDLHSDGPGDLTPLQRSETSAPSVAMPGADLFVITVDALRYDRLKKTGSKRSVMPNLDAFIETSALFTRGYSPIPHTSYAVTSLMTGKYTRPLFEVPGAPKAHETWPEILRRFRYETSAFFPPAVFFIDKARFEPYYRKGVGFLYKHVDARITPKEKVALLIDHVREKKKTGRPHFSWIHFFEAHEPYDPECTRFGNAPEDRYDCELYQVDEALHDLFSYLEQEDPNALVLVTSDHGEAFGEHGDRYHGTSLYDEQIRVPIVIHAPGIAPRTIASPVGLVDLLGTSLRLLDIPVPARVRSRNLAPLLFHDGALDAFSEVHDEAMVVYGDDKLICHTKTDLCRLYDLKNDPSETRSIAEQNPQRASEMKRRLSAWLGSHAQFELRPLQGPDGDETHEKWPVSIQKALAGDASVVPALASVVATSKAPMIRRKAAELIYRMARAVPENIDEKEADPIVAAWLTALRVKQGDRRAGPKLYEISQALIDETTVARQVHLTQLASGDSRAIPKALAIALSESAPIEERRWALQLLGGYQKGDLAASRLIPLINTYQLTLDAAEVLGKLKCASAVMPLVTRLKRERFPERKAAIIDALSAIGDWRAVSAITAELNLESPPTNVVSALENMVRPSPSGRRIPSDFPDQECLYYRPVKRLNLKFFFKKVSLLALRTKTKIPHGTLKVTCNHTEMGTIHLNEGDAESALDISQCLQRADDAPFIIDIIKNDDAIVVDAMIVLGSLVDGT